MRRAVGTPLAFAALLLAACLPRPAVACQTTPRVTVPLVVIDARTLVVVTVNGRPATFQLDTGAARSLVTPEAVRRLGLARDRWVGSTVRGLGGIERRSVADPASLSLAGIPLNHRNAIRDRTLTVASLGVSRVGSRTIDGLLGRDFLGAFDVVLDIRARRMTLWAVSGCSGRFLPWHVPYGVVDALPAYGDALVLPVTANGESLHALPDTGATRTLIAAPGIARLGLDAAARPPAGQASGVGSRTRAVWPVRLSSLRVGDETIRDKEVLAAEVHVFPIVDMLLGADWFAAHRVWLSYATGQVFFTTSG